MLQITAYKCYRIRVRFKVTNIFILISVEILFFHNTKFTFHANVSQIYIIIHQKFTFSDG